MLSRLGLGLALGQRATRVVFTSRPAAPRQLAHARRLLSSTPVYREQQDLKIPHLSPPWQVEDMSRLEKEKYNEYGPDYMTHVTEEEREHFERRAVQRAKAATALEEQLGDNWYAIMKRANKIRNEADDGVFSKFSARRDALRNQAKALLEAGKEQERSEVVAELKRVKGEMYNFTREARAKMDTYREIAKKQLQEEQA